MTCYPSAQMVDLPNLSGIKVLLVEDDPDTVEVTVAALRQCGASVWSATVAEEARPLLAEVVPDVVICDLALPREDGIAFVRWLRTPGKYATLRDAVFTHPTMAEGLGPLFGGVPARGQASADTRSGA